MDRTEWLASLKPGDNVVLELDNRAPYLRTVDYIDEDKIYIDGFDKSFVNGACRVGIDERGHDAYFYIIEYTDECKKKVERLMKLTKIRNYTWNEEDKLNQVYDILFGDKK